MREIYILAGQSNMMGRGALSPAQTYNNDARIFALYSDTGWGVGADPLHHDNVQAGVGPGMAFADKLLDLKGDPCLEIGLVPCAKSGSGINDWHSTWRPNNHYGNLIKQALIAREQGELKGLIWYQGETDAMASSYPLYWSTKLRQLIHDIRTDLGMPNLPVIITRLGPDPSSGTYPMWWAVQTYTDQMENIGVPNVAFVSASDLSAMPDKIHLTASAAVTLGHRYAQAMFDLQS